MAKLVVALAAWLSFAATPLLADDPPKPPDKAIIITITWDQSGPAVKDTKQAEEPVPLQRGFPQLWGRFFELQDKNEDVHFAGPLVDPRAARAGQPVSSTFRVVVPDDPEARHLVIYERVKGKRNPVLTRELP